MFTEEELRDLLDSVEGAINGSSDRKGAALLFVRDTLRAKLEGEQIKRLWSTTDSRHT